MKIAVVAPSPVPFTIGGMERHIWNITGKINELTQNQADLIKLPLRENDFWDLVESYHSFWALDLSHFDMVISTKYPSWMVSHKNHLCYMEHKLRGLYDTYHLTGLPTDVNSNCPHTIKLLEFLNKTYENPDIAGFWSAFEEFKSHKNEIPRENLVFPGPLIYKIIHYLDNYALDPSRIKRYCSQSRTVYSREGYFPRNVKVDIIYPPPSSREVGNITYDNYFFTVSRLDNAKRVKLLVDAMKYFKGDAMLVIAGTGPEESDIKKMSQFDKRIELKGFCIDEEVSNLYSNCLAVLYVPYEEDYGLVTVEAFLRRKPVITCTDSGGTMEFVVDGESGFIVPPNARSIAVAMERIYNDKERAKKMGANGFNKIRSLTWENFIAALLPGDVYRSERSVSRKKMLVLSTFPIFPPRGGGQIRIFNLYKNLAKYYDVDILSFTSTDQPPFNGKIAFGLREIRLPQSKHHREEEMKIEQRAGIPVTDVAMPRLSHLTPEFGATLREKAANSDLIIVSHPYLYDEVARAQTSTKIVYEAHNVEYDLKSKLLPKSASDILEEVYRVERSCCEKSELVMACSESDVKRLIELYNVTPEKIVIAPNGVDANETLFVSRAERKKNKARIGLENETLALFMGSWHPPNLEACREIFKMAKDLPDVKFLLMGSQCQAFQYEKIPTNVGLLGVLDDEEKNYIFSIVDVALNPMRNGSGTNLKMLDYMAAGIPLISTSFGARGMENAEQFLYLADELKDMEHAILSIAKDEDDSKQIKARAVIESIFDWGVISNILLKKFDN